MFVGKTLHHKINTKLLNSTVQLAEQLTVLGDLQQNVLWQIMFNILTAPDTACCFIRWAQQEKNRAFAWLHPACFSTASSLKSRMHVLAFTLSCRLPFDLGQDIYWEFQQNYQLTQTWSTGSAQVQAELELRKCVTTDMWSGTGRITVFIHSFKPVRLPGQGPLRWKMS